jgi:hypothetical protein
VKKPDTLRAALVAAMPDLANDPDRFLVFIDNGALHASYAPGLSFEYAYTLNIIITDFGGDPDTLMVPLLMWVSVNQSELMDNVDKRREGIRFEADIIDNARCDLSIKLQLTERVIVAHSADGVLTITHVDEPQPEGAYPPGHWQLYVTGPGVADQLVAEWDSPA